MSDTPRTDAATRMAFSGEYMVQIQDAQKLERELDDVTKQRDALVNAIRKHKTTLVFKPDYCDVVLYKTLDKLEQGELHE